jgi:hypothetical protein
MSPIASLIEIALSVLTMVAAGFSAWLWIRASRVPIPPFTGDNWRGEGPFNNALKRQSKLNADAAKCAALAAALQSMALMVHIFG